MDFLAVDQIIIQLWRQLGMVLEGVEQEHMDTQVNLQHQLQPEVMVEQEEQILIDMVQQLHKPMQVVVEEQFIIVHQG
jgi:hypothetical protein